MLPGKKRLASDTANVQWEFGGRGGLIQRFSDGHSLSPGESAMILRVHNLGANDDDRLVYPDEVTLDNAGELGVTEVVGAKRAAAAARVAGYVPEDVKDVENLA